MYLSLLITASHNSCTLYRMMIVNVMIVIINMFNSCTLRMTMIVMAGEEVSFEEMSEQLILFCEIIRANSTFFFSMQFKPPKRQKMTRPAAPKRPR